MSGPIKMSGKFLKVDRAVIEQALQLITEMHQTQMSAWIGPTEIQRQLLLVLGKDPEKWREENYG